MAGTFDSFSDRLASSSDWLISSFVVLLMIWGDSYVGKIFHMSAYSYVGNFVPPVWLNVPSVLHAHCN